MRAGLVYFLVFCLVCQTGLSAPRDCLDGYARAGGRSGKSFRERVREARAWTLKNGLKVTFLPYYLPAKILYATVEGRYSMRKVPLQIVREDGLATIVYAVLFYYNSTPLDLYLSKVVGVEHDKLAGDEPFAPDEKRTVVGINGVTDSERFSVAAQYMSGAHLANGKNIFHARAKRPDEIFSTMLEAYKKSGPIHKLVIAAHGMPGLLLIGGTPLNELYVIRNKELLEKLPKDLMAPGAEIVLISCSTGVATYLDSSTKDRIKNVFRPVMKQGGTLVVSTRYVAPNLSKIPSEYHDKDVGQFLGDLYLPPLLAMMDTMMVPFMDWQSLTNKVVRIPIEPYEASKP